MPSFSKSLESSLHRALEFANERNHEFATLEHLLAALIDDRDAAAVMRACNVDLDSLRARVGEYLDTELGNLVHKGSAEAQPTTASIPTNDPRQMLVNGLMAASSGEEILSKT